MAKRKNIPLSSHVAGSMDREGAAWILEDGHRSREKEKKMNEGQGRKV